MITNALASKHLNKALTLFVFALLLIAIMQICNRSAGGQQMAVSSGALSSSTLLKMDDKGTLVSVPDDPKAPSISSEELLKFRSLQLEQTRRVVRMQELKAEFDKLNGEQQKLAQDMSTWITDQAKKLNLSMEKVYFDADQLKFIERPKEPEKKP